MVSLDLFSHLGACTSKSRLIFFQMSSWSLRKMPSLCSFRGKNDWFLEMNGACSPSSLNIYTCHCLPLRWSVIEQLSWFADEAIYLPRCSLAIYLPRCNALSSDVASKQVEWLAGEMFDWLLYCHGDGCWTSLRNRSINNISAPHISLNSHQIFTNNTEK